MPLCVCVWVFVCVLVCVCTSDACEVGVEDACGREILQCMSVMHVLLYPVFVSAGRSQMHVFHGLQMHEVHGFLLKQEMKLLSLLLFECRMGYVSVHAWRLFGIRT